MHYWPAFFRDGSAGQVCTDGGARGLSSPHASSVQRLLILQVYGHGVPSQADGGMVQQVVDQLIPLLSRASVSQLSRANVSQVVLRYLAPLQGLWDSAAYSYGTALPGYDVLAGATWEPS